MALSHLSSTRTSLFGATPCAQGLPNEVGRAGGPAEAGAHTLRWCRAQSVTELPRMGFSRGSRAPALLRDCESDGGPSTWSSRAAIPLGAGDP